MSVLKQTLPFHEKNVHMKYLEEANWDDIDNDPQVDLQRFSFTVTKEGIDMCQDALPVIVYLAGYCCFSVVKKTSM